MAGTTSPAPETEGMEPLYVKTLQEAIKNAMLDIEADFSKKLEHFFSPVKSQLAELQPSLSKSEEIAETVSEMGVALQEESQSRQSEISDLKEKYTTLAASQRENNSKFHGQEDSIEGSMDLISFIGNWLATELNLEPKIFSTITKAYIMGAKKPDGPFPRDINVTFGDLWAKSRIQNLAHERNGLNYNDIKILVYPDIALSIRKNLKADNTQTSRSKNEVPLEFSRKIDGHS